MTIVSREFCRIGEPAGNEQQWWTLEFDLDAGELSVVSSRSGYATLHERRFVDEFFSDDHPKEAKDALRTLLADFIGGGKNA